MALSLVKNHIHIIFSTKNRIQLLHSATADELHNYIGGTCNNLECPSISVGGYTDHIHILCMLSRKIALMDLVGKVKANSSKWLKTKGKEFNNFSWQGGYGAFSVEQRNVERVAMYIQNQQEHHKIKTFKEEYIEFLNEYNLEYDVQYLWD